MSVEYLVIGHFSYPNEAVAAVVQLRAANVAEYWSYSPVPDHQLEEEIYRGKKRSPVRACTLLGGISGCLFAFLMTCWMSMDWPLRTSAKPILSIPAFVIIGFECTILFGALATLFGMSLFSRLPNLLFDPGYRGEFSKDTFGIIARVEKDRHAQIGALLTSSGAKLVEYEYVR